MTFTDEGTCPVCGRQFQIKKDGTLRHHAGPPGSEPGKFYGQRRKYRCDGAGQAPTKETAS